MLTPIDFCCLFVARPLMPLTTIWPWLETILTYIIVLLLSRDMCTRLWSLIGSLWYCAFFSCVPLRFCFHCSSTDSEYNFLLYLSHGSSLLAKTHHHFLHKRVYSVTYNLELQLWQNSRLLYIDRRQKSLIQLYNTYISYMLLPF